MKQPVCSKAQTVILGGYVMRNGFSPLKQVIPILSPTIAGLAFACLFLVGTPSVWADSNVAALGEEVEELRELMDLEIESLLDLPVTIASRTPRKVGKSPAPVFVLTGQEIRRSGVTSIPDALRLIPGVQVARLSSHQWAISIRGFNAVASSKLLVLLDGRTLYSPFEGGVAWRNVDYPLEDIDRIEVVRGPGAASWGSNAVNGVINIITRSARDTEGGLATFGGGNDLEMQGEVRYGMKVGEESAFRVFAKQREWGGTRKVRSQELSDDDWYDVRGGLRGDLQLTETAHLTTIGEIYSSHFDQDGLPATFGDSATLTETANAEASGGNAFGRLDYQVDEESSIMATTYFDRRVTQDVTQTVRRNTYDVELQYSTRALKDNELVVGGSYRYHDEKTGQDFVRLDPRNRGYDIAALFLQNEYLLTDDFRVVFSVRAEKNEYTDWEIQPALRALLEVTDSLSMWASVSRSASLPYRIATDSSFVVTIDPSFGFAQPVGFFRGDPDLDASVLKAFQYGIRYNPWSNVAFDVATFYNQYSNLYGISASGVGPVNLGIATVDALLVGPDTNQEAHSIGGEVVATVDVSDRCKVQAWYSYNHISYNLTAANALLPLGGDSNLFVPEHQASLRVFTDLTDSVSFDTQVRFVDQLVGTDIDPYVELNARLGVALTDQLEISVAGLNLIDSYHAEFPASPPAEIGRSVFGQALVSF